MELTCRHFSSPYQQKRLRERIWILPIPHLLPASNAQHSSTRYNLGSSSTDPSPESPFTPASPFTPKTPREVVLGGKPEKADRDKGTEVGVMESALDIEFEQVWETTSELNDDDLREMDVSPSSIPHPCAVSILTIFHHLVSSGGEHAVLCTSSGGRR